jgi:RHS repeat-associated protein
MTYPSTRQLNFSYDSIGRPSAVTGYLSNIGYNIAGEVTGDTLGNGVTEQFGYDANSLQLTSQKAGTASPYTNRMDLTYSYNAAAGQMGAGTTAGNAGQLMSVSGNIAAVTESAAYTYDNVGRLVTSNQTSNSESAQRRFAYDRWGNRTGVWDATSGGNQIQEISLEQSGGVPTNRIQGVATPGGNGGAPNYDGFFDVADCNVIAGWAWNANQPNTPIKLDVYDGNTLIKTVAANQFRQDLLNAGIGNGVHGFSIATPASLKNGAAHTIRVKFAGTSTELYNSPKSITCAAPASASYGGWVDLADCNVIAGWAWDSTQPNTPINVEIYDGNTQIAAVAANLFRQDLLKAGIGNGYHSFVIATPASLKNGATHTIRVKYAGTSTELHGSPKSVICGNYLYDYAGNVTNDTLHSYEYDSENRLVSVDAGSTASYAYDHQNRRYKRTIGTTVTHYVWQGSQVLAEHNGSTGSVITDYVYAGSRMIAKISGGATQYFLSDRLSTRLVLDNSGNVIGRQGHLPFGTDFGESGSQEKHHFTSYERDDESGTDYAVNRQYSQSVGRFMRPDPKKGCLSSPQSLNRYSYTLNDPANRMDPEGLESVKIPIEDEHLYKCENSPWATCKDFGEKIRDLTDSVNTRYWELDPNTASY